MTQYLSKEELLLLEIEENFLTFEKVDDIFKKKLPKDLVKHIYKFVDPICPKCSQCCNICRIYCYLGCLRKESQRDICNRPEFNKMVYRYNTPVVTYVDSNDTDDISVSSDDSIDQNDNM